MIQRELIGVLLLMLGVGVALPGCPPPGGGDGDGTNELIPGEMVSVAAGSFDMGSPVNEGYSNERPVHSVNLAAYEIGQFKVTNQEYADALNWANEQGLLTTASASSAAAYGYELLDLDNAPCQISYAGGQFVVESRNSLSMADHPVVCVTWYGAAAFCNWLSQDQGLASCYNTATWTCDFSNNGYHLPTEAQWERAAAWNGSKHYRYGTGSDILFWNTANFWDPDNDVYANPQGLTSEPYTSPVGYYTAVTSPAGCYDMSGNAYDWCNDWYDGSYYAGSPGSNPVGPDSGTSRVLRGGGWSDYNDGCRSAYRSNNTPSNNYGDVGFRLAK